MRCLRLLSTRAKARVTDALLSQLEGVCNRVTTNASILSRHGDDESYHPAVPPEAVAYARSTEEVVAVVRACAETRTPLIPFGAGTSLEGHIQATDGGVCLDLSEMNEVLQVNDEDMDCRVQAGVTRLRLNEELRATGLHVSQRQSKSRALPLILTQPYPKPKPRPCPQP